MYPLMLSKAALSMTAVMKLRKSVGSPILIVAISCEEHLLDPRPEALRDVGARGGRAFLALVLEGAPHHRDDERLHVRRRMREDEILPARLADDPRILVVALDVRCRSLPTCSGTSTVLPVK